MCSPCHSAKMVNVSVDTEQTYPYRPDKKLKQSDQALEGDIYALVGRRCDSDLQLIHCWQGEGSFSEGFDVFSRSNTCLHNDVKTACFVLASRKGHL